MIVAAMHCFDCNFGYSGVDLDLAVYIHSVHSAVVDIVIELDRLALVLDSLQ